MPVSEPEIKADRDRLRAEYAIKVHKLETQLDQAKLERARQLIDINRRDASISALETRHRCSCKPTWRRTRTPGACWSRPSADRLPKVEARLAEAKRLLFNRDREIAELTAGRQAPQAGARGGELASTPRRPRRSSALSTRAHHARTRPQPPATPSPRAKPALRSEIEALRSKTREQAMLIDRLQRTARPRLLLPALPPHPCQAGAPAARGSRGRHGPAAQGSVGGGGGAQLGARRGRVADASARRHRARDQQRSKRARKTRPARSPG